ncbi:MAG TPA: nitrilase-related carbon-nitrogen hydrolase, partial [Elusimicrobiales bacterium]|nr:nitrilase-related carbon-nitrogen hydrolase [Elusimicrobiales bacterium]
MKIAMCQINTTVGDVRKNSSKILAGLRRAEKAGAELAVFPEAALTGYPALDLWHDRSFIDSNIAALRALAARTGETACLLGYIDYNRSGKGKPLQ